MNLRQKYCIGLEARMGRMPHADIGALVQTGPEEVRKQGRTLDRNGYMAFGPAWLDIVIAGLATRGPLRALQVGANDGKEGDPVNQLFHLYAEHIILVEPIPELIPKLKESYADFDGQLAIENCAICNGSDRFILWRLKPDYWPSYIERVGRHPTAITSFDPAPLLAKVIDRMDVNQQDAQAMIEELDCPAISIEDLLNQHQWKSLDVLQVDAEGYDFEVIKSLGRFRPSIINFESFNLSREAWSEWKRWAEEEGYGYIQGRMDTLAIRGSHFAIEY